MPQGEPKIIPSQKSPPGPELLLLVLEIRDQLVQQGHRVLRHLAERERDKKRQRGINYIF